MPRSPVGNMVSSQTHRVAKKGSDEAKEFVLCDIHVAAIAPVPKLLILPWSRAVGVAVVPKPAHKLEVCDSACRHTCSSIHSPSVISMNQGKGNCLTE